MTRLQLFALSAFIDQLAESCEYIDNAEAARLDLIFVAECNAAGLDPIEVSFSAPGYFRLQAAMAAVDQVAPQMGRISHVGLVAEWNRMAAQK